MKLYLDDERQAPEGWIRVSTARQAVQLLELNHFEQISLDHDLGFSRDNKFKNGYDVLCWLEQQVVLNGYPIPIITIHSANPPARKKMYQAVRFINNFSLSS